MRGWLYTKSKFSREEAGRRRRGRIFHSTFIPRRFSSSCSLCPGEDYSAFIVCVGPGGGGRGGS